MANNPTERIAFDSVVILDCLQKRQGRYEWIEPIVKRAEAGELVVIVCAMGYAETVRVDGRTPEESLAIIREFFEKPWVVPVAVSIFVGEQAAEIQRNHRVDCADAVHLASAIQAGATVFLTNDGDSPTKKKRKSRALLPMDKKLIVNGQPLRVMTPEEYDNLLRAQAQPLIEMAKPKLRRRVTYSPPDKTEGAEESKEG